MQNSQRAGFTVVGGSGCGLIGTWPSYDGTGRYYIGHANDGHTIGRPGTIGEPYIFDNPQDAIDFARNFAQEKTE